MTMASVGEKATVNCLWIDRQSIIRIIRYCFGKGIMLLIRIIHFEPWLSDVMDVIEGTEYRILGIDTCNV